MYLNINMSSSYPNLLDQAVLRQFISETSEPREKPPLLQVPHCKHPAARDSQGYLL